MLKHLKYLVYLTIKTSHFLRHFCAKNLQCNLLDSFFSYYFQFNLVFAYHLICSNDEAEQWVHAEPWHSRTSFQLKNIQMALPRYEKLDLFSLLPFKSTLSCILEWWGEDFHDKHSLAGDHGNIFLTAVPGADVCVLEIMHQKQSLFVLSHIKHVWHICIIWLSNSCSKYSTCMQCLNSLCKTGWYLCGLGFYLVFTLMSIFKWLLLILHLLWSYDSF